MLTPYEVDQRIEQRERVAKVAALTPQHSAAEASLDADGDEDQAEEVRRRVQHEADPYCEPAEVPEVAHADLGKLYSDAVNAPTGYPSFGHVHPEAFRRGPVTGGRAAYGVNYDPPVRPAPVPSQAMNAAGITRPLIMDGRARPSVEGC